MQIVFLGTGTSGGIPEIACDCPVCVSPNSKNKRTRSSILLRNERGNNLLIDASSDLRQQALRENIWDVRHILLTHIHADHVFGINELRRFNWVNNAPVTLYMSKTIEPELKEVFRYIYTPPAQLGGGIPEVNNRLIEHGKSFKIDDFEITPLNIWHGKLLIFGFRINDIAYITDCSEIPAETRPFLKNLKVLVLNTLRERKHPTHFSLDESVAEAQKIGAERSYFTHIAHNLEHEETNAKLPAGIELAYDGLKIDI